MSKSQVASICSTNVAFTRRGTSTCWTAPAAHLDPCPESRQSPRLTSLSHEEVPQRVGRKCGPTLAAHFRPCPESRQSPRLTSLSHEEVSKTHCSLCTFMSVRRDTHPILWPSQWGTTDAETKPPPPPPNPEISKSLSCKSGTRQTLAWHASPPTRNDSPNF